MHLKGRSLRTAGFVLLYSLGAAAISGVRRAAEDLKSAATTMAEDYRDKATQAWDDAKVRVRTLQEDGEDYVRENPMKAVMTALGIGFVLGLIFRR